jgi:hypothetical protein
MAFCQGYTKKLTGCGTVTNKQARLNSTTNQTTKMNANNNDWTTVRNGGNPKTNGAFGSRASNETRSMPSAFSGRQAAASPAAERYREYNRMNAEAEAALASKAAREKRERDEKARTAERDALALTSETSYPSLGGGAAAAKRSTMNYGRVVAERAALDKLEAEARELAAAAAATTSSFDWAPTGLSLGAAKRRALIGTRCFDDGPEDYDGPEEDYGDNDVVSDDEEEDAPPAEGDGEYNADLGARRRRGDKNSLY